MEEKKNNKGLIIVLIMFLIICLAGSGYFIYKMVYVEKSVNNDITNSNSETNASNGITDEEAIALGQQIYEKAANYLKSFKQLTTVSTENDENIVNNFYYYRENFVDEFYEIFSNNIVIDDVFDAGDAVGDAIKFNYIQKDNKYYIDSGCRANGFVANFNNDIQLLNKSENIINYSYSINIFSGVDSKSETKEMQLIKENNTWKINKITLMERCDNPVNIPNNEKDS